MYSFAQSSSHANVRLVVEIHQEASLEWQGDSEVLVKVRLAPRTQARLWAADSCVTHGQSGYSISSSGTYTIPLSVIDGVGKPMVCLSSSDRRLTAHLAVSTR